jgi:signal transduction histidine kinase
MCVPYVAQIAGGEVTWRTRDHNMAVMWERSRAFGRDLWRSLGQRSSTSALVAWIYAPIGLWAAFVVEWSRLDIAVGVWLSLVILGQLVVVGVLPLLGLAVHRFFAPRFWAGATAVAMLLTIALRGFAIEQAAVLIGQSPSIDWAAWGLSIFTQTGLLIMIGVRVSRRVDERNELRALIGQRDALLQEDADLRTRIAEADRRLDVQIGLTVEPRLRLLDDQLAAVEHGGDPAVPLWTLRTFVDNELLPLSHRFADSVTPWSIDGEQQVELPDTPTEVRPSHLNAGQVLRPGLIGTVAVLFSLTAASTRLPFGIGLLYSVAVTAFVLVLLFAVRRMFVGTTFPVPLAFGFAGIVVAVVFAVSVRVLLLIAGVSQLRSVPFAFGVGVVIGLLSALATFVDARFRSTRDLLQEQVQELQDVTSQWRQGLWIRRRRFGYALHGGLQSALHAAALRLVALSDDDVSRVAGIRADIQEAYARVMAASSHAPDLPEVVRDTMEAWEGVCDVTCEIPADLTETLSTYPTASECSGEVVLELVQNSVKHGAASAVHVRVEEAGDRLVLQVTDNGSWRSGPEGIGSQLMDEFCSRWERNVLESGTVVRAEVMLT